jgi:hypothetical protein
MKRIGCCSIGVVFVLASLPSSAYADAHDAALGRAVAAKEAALDRPGPETWQEAYQRFLEADAIEASADTKYELGTISLQLKQDDLAVSYFEDALSLDLSEPARNKALVLLSQLAPAMARIEVSGAQGTRLRIRGLHRGTLPLAKPIVTSSGFTEVEVVDSNGVRLNTHSLSLAPGETKVLHLDPVPNEIGTQVAPPPTVPIRISSAGPSGHYSNDSVRSTGIWMASAGLGLLVSSALFLPMSYSMLGSKRESLRNACDVPSNARDGCQNSRPGRYDEALALADDISRWKTVRAVAWTGVAIGAASAVFGYTLTTGKRSATVRQDRVQLTPTADQRSLVFQCKIAF